MKPSLYYVLVALAALSLVLCLSVVGLDSSNQTLDAQVQDNQQILQKGANAQQLGNNLVKTLAEAAGGNEKIKDLLTNHGYTIQPAQTAPQP